MKDARKCAGCDRSLFSAPGIFDHGVHRVDLVLTSGNLCSVTLCRRCRRCQPALLPRIWREYVEAMSASTARTASGDSLPEKALRLFRHDVPLGVLRSDPMGAS